LDITLLGRVTIRTADGMEIRLVGRHVQALFTLLALNRRPRTREAIATDLWPESLVAATGPLRQALYQLRTSLVAAGLLVDAILESDAETVGLRPEAIRSLDVAMFEACTDDLPTHAEEAVALYAGDLAEGLGHDCFAAERERLADWYEDALAIVDLSETAVLADDLGSRPGHPVDRDENLVCLFAQRVSRDQALRGDPRTILVAVG
jgi:DNA-binding SARP family transcriptional activator